MKRKLTLPKPRNVAAGRNKTTNGNGRSSHPPAAIDPNGGSRPKSKKSSAWRGVVGVSGNTQFVGAELVWDEDRHPADNYSHLGKQLAEAGDLFRGPIIGGGLVRLFRDGKHAQINKGSELLPVIVDRVPVRVIKDGKSKGSKIDAVHLNAMLQSEAFLDHFFPVDHISTVPMYLPGFVGTKPGYNDGGHDQRVIYMGGAPEISDSLETISTFLDVMAFDSNADRTNTVAAALTVLLRNFWPGNKPVISVTANKSHAGKDTVISFAAGLAGSVSISYQSTDWALERSFVGAVKQCPEAGVVVVENARLQRSQRFMASGFLERFVTDPEPLLFSTGTGAAARRRNDLVLAISTNFGSVSEDLLNRSLPIHLSPVGEVASRRSPIGNPRYEFLPANRERIAAELRGMVERWKQAGQPLDEDARHPFSMWSKTIGGIVQTSGFPDFLANYGTRKANDDPVRKGIGLLGTAKPNEWLRPSTWATLATDLGVMKMVIPDTDRENDTSRARGIGVVLSALEQEVFVVETETETAAFKLEKRRARFGGEPQVRYRFVPVDRQNPSESPEDAQ